MAAIIGNQNLPLQGQQRPLTLADKIAESLARNNNGSQLALGNAQPLELPAGSQQDPAALPPGFVLQPLQPQQQQQDQQPAQFGAVLPPGFVLQEVPADIAEQPDFGERLAVDLEERKSKVLESLIRTAQDGQTLPETVFQLGTQGLGVLGDVVGEGIVSAVQALPDVIKEPIATKINEIMSTEAGQSAIEALNQGAEAYGEWAKDNPRFAANIEGLFTFATTTFAAIKGVPPAVKGIAKGRSVIKSVFPRRGEIAKLFGDISERGLEGTAAFTKLRTGLQKEAVKQQKKTSTLFKQAVERGQNAFIPDIEINKLAADMASQALKEIDLDARALFNGASRSLKQLTKPGKPTGILDVTGQPIRRPTFNNINEIESLRRSASKASRSLEGGKRFAGGTIARQLDDFLGKGELITGDKEAVTLWRKAIRNRRLFGQKFENPSTIAKAIKEGTGESVEQAFIGSGGASLNKELSNVYKDTLKALPDKEKSIGGFLLRQSIVNRWVKNAARATDQPDAISASRMSNQIKNFRTENQSMWKLFPEDERKTLMKLENDLRKVSKAGVLDIISSSFVKIARKFRIAGNIELPRTLKPKTIVTVDELLKLTKAKPKK